MRRGASADEPLLDALVSLVDGEVERQAKSLARASLHTIKANGLSQYVPGDSEQPGESRPAALIAEAIAAQPRLRERLRR